jgi:hypothetical protein
MRLSETITIYLAAGAPFAVSYFLQARASPGRAQLLLRAIAAGLLWPLAALKIFFAHEAQSASAGAAEIVPPLHEEKIDEAKRNLLAALHAVSELANGAFGGSCEKLERAACVLRDSVERYVGLAHATEEADADAPPNERELELFRIAGRRGDELRLAGRCVHRRNVARLIEHHARARTELLHALADIREAAESARPQVFANASASRRLSLATLKLYGHAVELLSLLEDADAAMRAAQLLNQECARLRRLQPAVAGDASEHQTGEELCTAHTSRPPLAPFSNGTPLAQG